MDFFLYSILFIIIAYSMGLAIGYYIGHNIDQGKKEKGS